MGDSLRYFFDQHIPAAVAQALQRRGIDVLTALQAGRCGLPDPDQLQFATSQDRVLTTFDADYLVLAAAGTPHTGIAYCPATKYTVGQLIQVLVLLHGVLSRTDMHNHVEYL